ncbi:MAG: hypothetical protein OEY89_02425 [Gammaproteobacteria bacterium]|nr:hypothetical protein [Gammaproteobacteria bacterium]
MEYVIAGRETEGRETEGIVALSLENRGGGISLMAQKVGDASSFTLFALKEDGAFKAISSVPRRLGFPLNGDGQVVVKYD